MAYSKKKRKAPTSSDTDSILEIMPLGAGNEVGRSCIVIKYKGKSVMLDCGVHPAYSGFAGLPFFDAIDPSTIDLLLVSHFHLDHAAGLPYFLEKTSFRGKVYMTHPTKAIYKMLLMDYVKISNIAVEDMLYDEKDLLNSMEKIELINYHQELEHNGIKFTCYNAGHVLGAAMFMVEIAGVRILYTGDFSRQEDRHLMAAETPPMSPDVLIVESTYGVQIHQPRKEREARFTGVIHDIVRRGGRALIPVFALGRAQELLLILDEYWESHPELHHVPIYYASSLAQKCMKVYQTYINMMNEKIRAQFAVANPFVFRHISNLKGMEHFDDSGPCVVMASPGMLQSGLSRELFERWCTDPRNGVMIPGYCVEGTLAKHIMNSPSHIKTLSGETLPLNMSVDYISFSAHSDFKQTSEFIDILKPPNVVLVHGDANEMGRLKQALMSKYEGTNMQVLTPKNCQTVALRFREEKVAKVIGALALAVTASGSEKLPNAKPAVVETQIAGIMVTRDFVHHVMTPSELPTFTQLSTTAVLQRQLAPFHHAFDTLADALSQMYDDVVRTHRDDRPTIELGCGAVAVTYRSDQQIELEWTAGPVGDMLADSVVAVAMQLESNPASFKRVSTRQGTDEHRRVVEDLLRRQFGPQVAVADGKATVTVNGCTAVATLPTIDDVRGARAPAVECENPILGDRLAGALQAIGAAVHPVARRRVTIKHREQQQAATPPADAMAVDHAAVQ